MKRTKMNSMFDDLLKTLPKNTVNVLKTSCPVNLSTDSSDDFQSPVHIAQNSLYLFATPPLDTSKQQFFSPGLLLDDLGKAKKNKRIQHETKKTRKRKEPKAEKQKAVKKKKIEKEKNAEAPSSIYPYYDKSSCNWDEIDKMVTPIAPVSKNFSNALQNSGEIRQALFSEIRKSKRKRTALASRDPNTACFKPTKNSVNKFLNHKKELKALHKGTLQGINHPIKAQKKSPALDTPAIRDALLVERNKDSKSPCLFTSDSESIRNGEIDIERHSPSNSLNVPSLDTSNVNCYKTSTPNDGNNITNTPRYLPAFASRFSSIQKKKSPLQMSRKLLATAKQRLRKLQDKSKSEVKNDYSRDCLVEISCGKAASIQECPVIVGNKTNLMINNTYKIKTLTDNSEILPTRCEVIVRKLSIVEIEKIRLNLKRNSAVASKRDTVENKSQCKRISLSNYKNQSKRNRSESFLCTSNKKRSSLERNMSEELFYSCDMGADSSSDTCGKPSGSSENVRHLGVCKFVSNQEKGLVSPRTMCRNVKSGNSLVQKDTSPRLKQTLLPFVPYCPSPIVLSSPKLKQTCLPFLPDRPPSKSIQETPRKNFDKETADTSFSESVSSVSSSTSNSTVSSGRLRQTLLDMFMSSSDSEFNGFPESEVVPLKKTVQSPRPESKSTYKMAKVSSPSRGLIHSTPGKLQDSRKSLKPQCSSEERTRSLISFFLDLSVDSAQLVSSSRNKSKKVIQDGVKCNSSIADLLAGKEPKVILNRLDEAVVKASLLGPLTARRKVMALCDQSEPIPFKNVLPLSILQTAKKIGEGSYGEVFSMKETDGTQRAVKIIPIEGDQEVNGGPQMTFKDVLSEVILSKQLHDLSRGTVFQTSNFIHLHRVSCVVGKYPKKLLTEWNSFKNHRGTENDDPGVFHSKQLYIVFQFSFGGSDLEIYKLTKEAEAVSIFSQVTCCLAVAESALEFEHRDLHWGNILVAPTTEATVDYVIESQPLLIKTCGVTVSLIDFTLSRFKTDGASVFKDISKDPDIFNGKGDIQFDVYREMKKCTRNKWDRFSPFTNILWLEYLAKKLLAKLNLPKNRRNQGKLFKWKSISKQYKSARDLVSNEFCNVQNLTKDVE